MNTSDAPMLITTAAKIATRRPISSEMRPRGRHRAGEIDGVDQGQRDLREMKLVAIDDVERRGSVAPMNKSVSTRAAA